MQSIKTRRSLLAPGIASLALISLAGAVQAQPRTPDYQSYDSGRSDQYETRDDVRYGNYGRVVTLEAIVISRRDNNEFRVRAGGEEFDVRSDYNVDVRSGDRVTLRGSFDQGNDFSASTVDFVGRRQDLPGDDDHYGDDYQQGRDGRVDFPGVVTRVIDRNEFVVRGENGRTYRVKTRTNYPNLRTGTRLRVQGRTNGVTISSATFVDVDRPGGGFAGGYGNAQKVDFPGRIIRLDRSRNQTTVRGDNGRDYLIRGNEVDGVYVDQRVRVRGYARDGVVDLTDLERLR